MIIHCPKCKNMVSDLSAYCPYCSAPLSAGQSDTSNENAGGKQSNSNLKTVILCAAASVLLLGGLLYLILGTSDSQPAAEEYTEKRSEYTQTTDPVADYEEIATEMTTEESVGYEEYYDEDDEYVEHDEDGYNEEEEYFEEEEDVMVYANAYDGFINIRETANSRGNVIGKLRNGPNGAVFMYQTGEWVCINYNGLIGFVYEKYVSYSPTSSVYLSIDGDWLRGVWRQYDSSYAYLIFNNGTFAIQSTSKMIAYGVYMLEGNDIVLTIKEYLSSGWSIPSVQRKYVDTYYEKIGDMSKYRFIEDSEKYYYAGELYWTQSEYTSLRTRVKDMLNW